MGAFNLAQFDTATKQNNGATMHLKNDKGELCYFDDKKTIPVTLKLAGIDSDFFAFAKLKSARYSAEQMILIRSGSDAGKKPRELTVEEEVALKVEAQSIILAGSTLGWTGIPGPDGKELPFSQDAVLEIYRKYNVIRTQADSFIANRANFT
jgi:hypothetical protein